MFDYYGEKFFIEDNTFVNNPCISFAIFKVEKTKNPKMIYPYGNTSAGKKKSVLLGKIYNEYLERFKMVNNDRIEAKVDLVSLNDLSVEMQSRKTLTYETDDIYGLKDTTGTSSGLDSSFLVEKAVLELIEKNELIPIWYKKNVKKLKLQIV